MMRIDMSIGSYGYMVFSCILLWLGFWYGYRNKGYDLILWNIALIIILGIVALIERRKSKNG
jgi:hypothetical protein